jgi:drug/metabolite transporter (DMT)-like permease
VTHGFALLCSMGAAIALGGSAVLQHSAAAAHPHLGPLRLVVQLIRTPRWLAGRTFDLIALVLHALALANGPLVLVQAVLASSLLVALGIGAVAGHHRLTHKEWAAAGAVGVGLIVLLGIGHPHGGDPPSIGDWTAIVTTTAIACACVLALEPRLSRRMQAAALGTVSGVLFAVDAAFLKAALRDPLHGWMQPLHRWEMFAFLGTAAVGNVLVARAFQRAPLPASLPGVTAAEPVAAIIIGLAFFSEHLRPGAAPRAAEVLAVGALVAGVLHLARSPVLEAVEADYAEHDVDPSEPSR